MFKDPELQGDLHDDRSILFSATPKRKMHAAGAKGIRVVRPLPPIIHCSSSDGSSSSSSVSDVICRSSGFSQTKGTAGCGQRKMKKNCNDNMHYN